jgi:cytochrome c1
MRSDRRNQLIGAAAVAALGVAIGAWLRGHWFPARLAAADARRRLQLPRSARPHLVIRARPQTRERAIPIFGALLVIVFVAALGAAAWRMERARQDELAIASALGGDPHRAVAVMLGNGCSGCHTIPGVPGAAGNVGPRLDGKLADKIYIGGVLPNTPANLVRWIRDARSVDPHTAMPSTYISDQQARDVAAYLYALR